MTYYEIPLQSLASQLLNITIGSDIIKIRLKTLQDISGIFIDVNINDVDIIIGAQCKYDVNILSTVQYKLKDSPLKILFFKNESGKNNIDFNDLGNTVRLYYAI